MRSCFWRNQLALISLLFTCTYDSLMCGGGDQYFVGFIALLIKFVDASFEGRTWTIAEGRTWTIAALCFHGVYANEINVNMVLFSCYYDDDDDDDDDVSGAGFWSTLLIWLFEVFLIYMRRQIYFRWRGLFFLWTYAVVLWGMYVYSLRTLTKEKPRNFFPRFI